ncbi:hypothetical protein SOASR030_01190 [Leminorella grimontii]|uniref:Uncharacterized protein n=1 Tax=Leminorella grimontii TaxID=82981 RepID=A0AAV5MX31_9GAMM|nr:hypothetical protein [Leminorella grimontii]KFC95425.1 hypothetical protein GLGR_1966 [Leminorella grimontii ATCC 33999 = DSM 5078]GKX54007.1 hypothetical protein SOASR030_01190 [Leminorella grimontii]VFS60327.1 Uncharacterised protein [Leminorella grimontii]
MATIPNQTHPLLSIPLSAAADFIALADCCERFAEALTESDDPALRIALCGRLAASLTWLRVTLDDPIPAHLIERLTADALPVSSPGFEPDSERLCAYGLALAQLLSSRTLPPDMEQTLSELLFGLVCQLVDGLNAPRWVRTADGVTPISEEPL